MPHIWLGKDSPKGLPGRLAMVCQWQQIARPVVLPGPSGRTAARIPSPFQETVNHVDTAHPSAEDMSASQQTVIRNIVDMPTQDDTPISQPTGKLVTDTKNPGAPADTASFEASVERLSEIVEQLEAGELPLEQSLQLFEEGIRLARAAQERLDNAEQRVEELLSVDAQGRAALRTIS